MESDKTEQAAAVVISQQESVKPEPTKVEAKPERKDSTLRETLKKNFDKSEDASGKPTSSTPETPAVNKSFVNGEAQQVAKPVDNVLAPASMNAEEKKVWETLPTEAKKFLSRREYETRSHLTQQTQGLSLKEKEVSDVLGSITPQIREEYTRQGIAIPDLVRRTIAWDKRVKEGIDGALEFLEAHGYKASDLANHKAEPAEAPVYLTKEQAEQLAEETFNKKLELHQQSSIAESNANTLQSWIDSKPVFKSDPGTAAQVENAVAEEIEYLKFRGFQGSTAQLLETAYTRAIANNEALSSLRPQAVTQQTAKPENIHEQMERVRAAKAASRSANGSLGSGSPMHKSNSLRESLERNFAKT
jgi:hypothetical protein